MLKHDLHRISFEYTKYLIDLQKSIFKRNEELNVFKYEVIPAIQYCNAAFLQSIVEYYKDYVKTLEKNATYLNVGSGCNFLEVEARENGIFMDCADIEKTKLIFNPLRTLVNTPLTYTADLYDYELNIQNCDEKYDYIMFVRYVPFEYNLDEEKFISFLRSTKKYADNIIISIVKDSYHELKAFFNQHNDIIINQYQVKNSINYIIDTDKLNKL